MIVDSSAILAILFGEAETSAIAKALEGANRLVLSAASYVEVSIVLSSRNKASGIGLFDSLLMASNIQIEPVTANQAHIARLAFQKYGKGIHKAGLNFGDCFSYALAKETGEPLLFKGNDFSLTDIKIVDY